MALTPARQIYPPPNSATCHPFGAEKAENSKLPKPLPLSDLNTAVSTLSEAGGNNHFYNSVASCNCLELMYSGRNQVSLATRTNNVNPERREISKHLQQQ